MKLINSGSSFISLGLMSGTSLDGTDVSIIQTDGEKILDFGPSVSIPYSDHFRETLKNAVLRAGRSNQFTSEDSLGRELASINIEAVTKFLSINIVDSKFKRPDIIGFHGHTILHRPDQGFSKQIGDCQYLASELGIPVVGNFRARDIYGGGQGAPLVPVYHKALFSEHKKPLCVVNIGGIANITWIGNSDKDIIAFDTGPGNGLIDSWVEQKIGNRFDIDGIVASQGQIHGNILDKLMDNSYFSRKFPKSLDRSDFNLQEIKNLSLEDGAATLTAFTAETILLGIRQCPLPPEVVFITGGGRHNKTIMDSLNKEYLFNIYPIEHADFDGDALESQAFAFLAVRSVKKDPITFPSTTGVSRPSTGGQTFFP